MIQSSIDDPAVSIIDLKHYTKVARKDAAWPISSIPAGQYGPRLSSRHNYTNHIFLFRIICHSTTIGTQAG